MKKQYYTKKKGVDIWSRKKPLLSRLSMDLTERCNNNCIHCCINLPSDHSVAEQKELSTNEIKDIISDAASLGCLTVRFTGGEPLLRQDFEELYVSTRKLGMKVVLFTNATLITPKLARLFARIPPLKKIEVSLYGMKKSSYEKITRTPNSFESAWLGIKLLLRENIPFIVKTVLLPPNKKEIIEFESWAAKIPWMNGSPSWTLFLDLRHRRDSEAKNRVIKDLRLSAEECLKMLVRDQEAYKNDMKEFCSKFIRPPGDNLFSCGAGVGDCHVDAYGNLQPCLLLRHPDAIYNLKKGFLKIAVTRFFKELREMKAENPSYLSRCANCFLKGLCEQCPAKSWMEYGTMDTPVEYLCDVAHVQATHLGLLVHGEKAWEVKNWKEKIKRFSEN